MNARRLIGLGIIFCTAIVKLMASVSPAALPQLPPARVKLIGIAILPPHKWVLLEVEEYQQPPVQITLLQGARREFLQVLEVDSKCGWAIICNAGVDVKLTIEMPATAAPNLVSILDEEHRPLPLPPPPGAGDP